MPTIPVVNVHVHVGDVASGSSKRVDGPADIAKEKSEKPTQPVSIDFPLFVFGKGVVDRINPDSTNSFHGLNIWMLLFVSHVVFSSIAIQKMHSLRTVQGLET